MIGYEENSFVEFMARFFFSSNRTIFWILLYFEQVGKGGIMKPCTRMDCTLMAFLMVIRLGISFSMETGKLWYESIRC